MTESRIHLAPLHKNATITELKIDDDSSPQSLAPAYIATDNLTLRPIFDFDFLSVKTLYDGLDTDVLDYYSERHLSLPDEIRDSMLDRKAQWESATRYEYGIEYEGELVGKAYFAPHDSMSACVFGIWIDKSYWGKAIAQERADAFVHIAFEYLDFSFVTVGALIENRNSIRSIEKYIDRYGGSYYGNVPVSTNRYYPADDPHDVSDHPEWMITKSDFESGATGISTTIRGVSYDEIHPLSNHRS